MERVKPELRDTINGHLTKLIADSGGDLTAFAKSIGVSRDTVNNWLRGKSDIRLNDLVNISQVYGKSIDWFLGTVEEHNYSTNALVRMVSEYTGLSTAAVEILHRNATDKGIDKRYFPILGEILSFNSIYESIGCLIRAKHFKEKDQEMMASNPDAYKQMDAIIKSLNDNLNMSDKNDPNVILTNGEAADYYLNRASEWYTNLCKHIVNGGGS